MEKQKA